MVVLSLEVIASARTDHLKILPHHLGIQTSHLQGLFCWFVFLREPSWTGSKKTPCLLSTCAPCQVHRKHSSLSCPKLWENSHLQHNISLSSEGLPATVRLHSSVPHFLVLPSKAPFTKLAMKLIRVVSGELQELWYHSSFCLSAEKN